jgi:hypothetical protein
MFGPDDFLNDPYGHLTNQAGHAYLVGAPAAAILSIWWGLIAAPVLVAICYGLIWEIGVQRLRIWRDSLEDTVHVMAGASVMCAALSGDLRLVAGCFLAQGVLLVVGIYRRLPW